MKGIVTKSTGSWYTVYYENGERVDCRLKGKFRMKGITSTNPVSVGDHVIFEFEAGKETGVINTILDRKNYIIRKSVNLSKQTHIIASNIDLGILLVTINNPVTSTSFIDIDKVELTEVQKEAYESIDKLNMIAYNLVDGNLEEFKSELAVVKEILKLNV